MVTTYFLNNIMGNVFKTQTTPALPSNFYLGLSTTAPNVSGGNVTEPATSKGYARVLMSSLSTPSNGVIANTSDVVFPESTSSWGTITHLVVYDASTSGNLLLYEPLTSSKVVDSGTSVALKSSKFELTLSSSS